MARPYVSTHTDVALDSFQLVSTKAGAHASPSSVDFADALEAPAPCTVSHALSKAGRLDWAAPPDIDADDHWFRAFIPALAPGARHELVFEGLASLVDVWLAGSLVLHAENMFAEERLLLPENVGAGVELVLCFRALKPWLALRRPRPRWRTRIVEQQQLRYLRTSLLGRTPGFCPALPVVGPYRPVRVETQRDLKLNARAFATSVQSTTGELRVALRLQVLGAAAAWKATLRVEGAAGSGSGELALTHSDGELRLDGTLVLAEVARWWPHTHGPQPLSRAYVSLVASGAQPIEVELGQVGFRSLTVARDLDGQGFGLLVNDVSVFCRGACWTTDDLLTLGSAGLYRTLQQARAAGMNMLRITGTSAYESDAFYDACDELGILVFQDFMFANMDYPIADASFANEAQREARHLLSRIGFRPSLAVLCGGSEVEQQAAMLGLPAAQWTSPLFSELLPGVCSELAPGVPYMPSSPTGGALPFHPNAGLAHYYGVGAYQRPLEDARRARVRFASECLAFANVPCRATVEAFMKDLEAPYHHPRWKQRVPRDRGSSWDFEDTRDHYLERLFGVNPRELRYNDVERYLALGSAAVGEAMLATYSEWRSHGSSCRGALVLWLKDFWPGAGWGVIDALGYEKSAYYYLSRVMQPLSLVATDEGLSGLTLHAINERATPLSVELSVSLYRAGETLVETKKVQLALAPRSVTPMSVDSVLGHFRDSTYAYRFGPSGHDLSVASLRDEHEVVARAFHFPGGYARTPELDLGLSANAVERDGKLFLLVRTRRFAQTVWLELADHRVSDNWFHLEPGGERWLELTPRTTDKPVLGTVGALNALTRTTIRNTTPS